MAQPFELARSMLVHGQIQRRRKQKRAAREALQGARDAFADLGARLWVVRADAELARIGGRPPAPFELTASERSVADHRSRSGQHRGLELDGDAHA